MIYWKFSVFNRPEVLPSHDPTNKPRSKLMTRLHSLIHPRLERLIKYLFASKRISISNCSIVTHRGSHMSKHLMSINLQKSIQAPDRLSESFLSPMNSRRLIGCKRLVNCDQILHKSRKKKKTAFKLMNFTDH